MRAREPRADRRGQRVAEGAVRAVGQEVTPGVLQLVVGRQIRTRRTGIGHHDRVARQHAVQFGNHALGTDRPHCLRGERRERRELGLPGARDHGPAVVFHRWAIGQTCLHGTEQRLEHQSGVADERVVGAVVGRHRHRVHVDVHDRHVPRRCRCPFGGGGAGAAADEHHEVGLLHHVARGHDPAVQADHADAERMRVGDAALAAHGRAHRRVQQRRHLGKHVRGAGGNHATAADEHGPARAQDSLRRGRHRHRVRARGPGRVAIVARLRPDLGRVHRLRQHVVGQADVRRTRTSGRHVAEGRANRLGYLVGPVAHGVPLGERAIERLLIELGQRIPAARQHGHVGRDPEHWRTRLVGFDQPRQ